MSVKETFFAYKPIAFLAFKNGRLSQLDALLEMFEIEKKGTTDFKNRLNEKIWIDAVNNAAKNFASAQNPDNAKKELIKQVSKKSPMSVLSELVVARYLQEKTPHQVTEMAATSIKAASDVVTEKAKIEVKYLDDSPEWKKNILDNLGGEIATMWLDEDSMINFFYIRIAEAAMQLGRTNDKLKIAWFVFSQLAADNKDDFQQYYSGLLDWRRGLDILLNGLFKNEEEKKERIKSKKPNEWLKEIDHLILSVFEPTWSLSKVHLIKSNSTTIHEPKSPLY